jgi:TatD DNase family protein
MTDTEDWLVAAASALADDRDAEDAAIAELSTARSAEVGASRPWLFFDSHCHVHDSSEQTVEAPHTRLTLMAVHEADWHTVLRIWSAHREKQTNVTDGKIVACVGIHPWHLGTCSEGWLGRMEALLLANPFLCVGEIGLDKLRAKRQQRVEKEKGSAWLHMQDVFVAQLRLAGKLQRPASVHCVQAFGQLLSILEDDQDRVLIGGRSDWGGNTLLPPRIALHSFSGRVDVLRTLRGVEARTGMHVYFSFSMVINIPFGAISQQIDSANVRFSRLVAAVREVPDDRLLLESDLDSATDVDRNMLKIAMVVAAAKGLTVERVLELSRENATTFFEVDE